MLRVAKPEHGLGPPRRSRLLFTRHSRKVRAPQGTVTGKSSRPRMAGRESAARGKTATCADGRLGNRRPEQAAGVKGCGKSAPRMPRGTWQCKPHREQTQTARVRPARLSANGCWGSRATPIPRQMIARDRTRLTSGRPSPSLLLRVWVFFLEKGQGRVKPYEPVRIKRRCEGARPARTPLCPTPSPVLLFARPSKSDRPVWVPHRPNFWDASASGKQPGTMWQTLTAVSR